MGWVEKVRYQHSYAKCTIPAWDATFDAGSKYACDICGQVWTFMGLRDTGQGEQAHWVPDQGRPRPPVKPVEPGRDDVRPVRFGDLTPPGKP